MIIQGIALTEDVLYSLRMIQNQPDYYQLIKDTFDKIIERITIDDELSDSESMAIIRVLYMVRREYETLANHFSTQDPDDDDYLDDDDDDLDDDPTEDTMLPASDQQKQPNSLETSQEG